MPLGDGVGAGDLPRIDDRDAVLSAIRRAGASDLVGTDGHGDGDLTDGLDTLLGPYVGGRALSGGQWQRLALARGLMRDRPLLTVLDEPTASLDAPSEAALFASYRDAARRQGSGAGITVLVSHRFGTVHMADQIIVLEGGRIAESGDHQSLIRAGGVYAELFTLQAAGYQALRRPRPPGWRTGCGTGRHTGRPRPAAPRACRAG
jgi:ATP-binding cassette subfamily B protein